MRRPQWKLGAVIAAGVLALPLLGGCEAKVYGAPPAPPEATVVAAQVPRAPLPETPPPASFRGLDERARLATDEAVRAGADLTVMVLDRNTGQRISNGNGRSIATASVAKLFIVDDLLSRQADLSAEDRSAIEVMLRSSDDNAAEIFWGRGGGNAIITRVADRYGLGSTHPPGNGRWWNTVSTAADLVRYYDMLISGAGGLPADRANIILSNLAQITPTGMDGYPQRFGIPDGLPAERVAVKQGWMCCIGSAWMHLSAGVIGADRRYVMAIGSMQAGSESVARDTITQAVQTMFPDGRI